MSEETTTVESTITEETIREALRGVEDPELHLDVVAFNSRRFF